MKGIVAELSPLRASGMYILNYLNDWVILAHPRDVLISHTDMPLRHLESLGTFEERNSSQRVEAASQLSLEYLGLLWEGEGGSVCDE